MSDDNAPEATGGEATAFAAGVATATATEAAEKSQSAEMLADMAESTATSAHRRVDEVEGQAAEAEAVAHMTAADFTAYRDENEARWQRLESLLNNHAQPEGERKAPAPAPKATAESPAEPAQGAGSSPAKAEDTGGDDSAPKRKGRSDGFSGAWFGRD